MTPWMPRPVGVRIVFGAPVPAPRAVKEAMAASAAAKQVNDEVEARRCERDAVEGMHAAYVAALVVIFEKHKAASGITGPLKIV